jgi:hypothetical protein
VTVTLEPGTYEVVRDLARMQGQSVSSVVAGLVDAVLPTVARVVEAGRAFEALSEEMRERVVSNFAAAEERLVPAVEELLGEALDLLAMPGTEPDPRLVTRGSRPPIRSHASDKGDPES